MVSAGFLVGGIFIVGLFVLGVFQSIPHSTLAGAVTDSSQKQINLCMNDCMRSCVTAEGQEQTCLDSCNTKCEVKNG